MTIIIVEGEQKQVVCRDSSGILLSILEILTSTPSLAIIPDVPISNKKAFSVLTGRKQTTDRAMLIEDGASLLEKEFPNFPNISELPGKLENLLSFSEKLDLLSEEIAVALVPKFGNDGRISYECAREISLKLSAVSGALSSVAFGQQEEAVQLLRSHLKELLVEIFINC